MKSKQKKVLSVIRNNALLTTHHLFIRAVTHIKKIRVALYPPVYAKPFKLTPNAKATQTRVL